MPDITKEEPIQVIIQEPRDNRVYVTNAEPLTTDTSNDIPIDDVYFYSCGCCKCSK